MLPTTLVACQDVVNIPQYLTVRRKDIILVLSWACHKNIQVRTLCGDTDFSFDSEF